MKIYARRVVLLAGAAILLILGVFLLAPERAKADLGNTGIPVRCFGNAGSTGSLFLTCATPAAAGISFVDIQRVPVGYYFLVTDVWATPNSGTSSALTDFNLNDCYGTTSIQSINRFRNLDGATFGQHFHAPMWVLPADHRLQVVVNTGTQQGFEIRVNGFLVTNITYVPMLTAQ